MAISRTNPLSLEAVNALPEGAHQAQIKELVRRIRDADEAVSPWIDKQRRLIKLRYGHRKSRSLPWKNASNITVPVIDRVIRSWRPVTASLILDANPIAVFDSQEAGDLDTARIEEPFFTWLFRVHMKTVKEAVRLVDLLAARGHAYAREGWDYRIERSARVVPTDKIFPEGVDEFLKAAIAQAATQNIELTPERAIVEKLAAEYDLDLSNESEAGQLLLAADRILQGAEYVRLVFQRVIRDRPCWTALDPIDTIFDQDSLDPETGDFFVVLHRMSANQINEHLRDGKFMPEPAAAVIDALQKGQADSDSSQPTSGGQSDNLRQRIKDLFDKKGGRNLEAAERSAKPRAQIWEVFCRLDLNDDGIDEKCVLWYAPDQDRVLALYEYPFPFEEWPITVYEFSHDAPRPLDNRGIPEMLLSFQKLVNAWENARIDAANLLLMPMYKYRTASGQAPPGFEFKPGALLPVTSMEDLQPLAQDLRLMSALFQERQISQSDAETYVGLFDATIRNTSNVRERRTATEIAAIQNSSSDIFGLDAKLFQESMSRSFNKIFKLWKEFGPDEVFFRVEGDKEPLRVRRSEIDREFDIRASGTPSNTSKAIMINNIERMMPPLLQDTSGVFDKGELITQWMKLIDSKIADKVIRPPEEAAAVQSVLQAASALGEEPAAF